MAGAREVRKRIKSVTNIAQITKAMELVAASRMRRAQETALAGRRYNQTLDNMLHNLLENAERERHPLLKANIGEQRRPTLMIVMAPDKGLCGALIANLLREVARYKADHREIAYMTMGRKARDIVRKVGGTVIADVPLKEKPRLSDIITLSDMAIKSFTSGEYSQVVVANTKFISTLKQQPQVFPLLPIATEELMGHSHSQAAAATHGFLYEPDADTVLDRLLPRYVEMTVFQGLLEALASEYSARMIAMKNAGDNAHDLQHDLTLTYNQLRQASITAELAEIASASAL